MASPPKGSKLKNNRDGVAGGKKDKKAAGIKQELDQDAPYSEDDDEEDVSDLPPAGKSQRRRLMSDKKKSNQGNGVHVNTVPMVA